MAAETILVVDDNKEIVYSLGKLLNFEGYNIVEAYDGMEALEALEKHHIDLILLDVMMPRLNGLSALMKIREKYKIPAIILSAKTEESDKVSGLILGADDYISKPYNAAELIARVKAQLRRYNTWGGSGPKADTDTIVNEGLVLDKKQRLVIVEGKDVKLTATEYKILALLMEHPGQVFPAEQIYENVWGEKADYTVENTVMVHIRHIREKIEIDTKNPKYIKVVWELATKWKNICDKILKIWKEEKRKLLGILMILIAFVLLFELLIVERYLYRPTRVIWIVGLCSNAFLGFGLTVFLRAHLLRSTAIGFRQTKRFDEWKMKWNAQQKKLLYIGVPLLLFVWFAGWNWYHYVGYYSNYAPIYLSIATVIIQYFVCQVCIYSFMKGKLELLMECMTDVSKMKLEEAMVLERESLKRAAKSEQLKVDLISNVSHDLKTPLTSMVGYIELMKKEELSDVTRDYVNVISDKAERLKEMIESLFSIAKASSGNVELNPEEIELNMLIAQIFADMSDKMENSGLKFVKALTDEDTCLVTDNLYMYRICQNLIENAIKYSAAGTRVFIKTFVKEIGGKEKISMEITNTAGYEMDFDKEDILERFARGDKARTSEGNGLGLAIVSTYAGALSGAFDINIDCDQFKATVTFPREMSVER